MIQNPELQSPESSQTWIGFIGSDYDLGIRWSDPRMLSPFCTSWRLAWWKTLRILRHMLKQLQRRLGATVCYSGQGSVSISSISFSSKSSLWPLARLWQAKELELKLQKKEEQKLKQQAEKERQREEKRRKAAEDKKETAAKKAKAGPGQCSSPGV